MVYFFKKEQKDEILKGRTLTYLSRFINLNYVYFTRIINNDISCSLKTAEKITKAIDKNAKVLDFFTEHKRSS